MQEVIRQRAARAIQTVPRQSLAEGGVVEAQEPVSVLVWRIVQPAFRQQDDLHLDGEDLGVHQDTIAVEDHGGGRLHGRA